MLGPHVAKEEGSLFPMLRHEGSLADHIGALEQEHAGLYDAVDDLDGADWDAMDRWEQGQLLSQPTVGGARS